MDPRSDPERIFQAGRATIRYGLIDTGMDETTADRWCDAWEIEAANRDLPRDGAYWQSAYDWIAAERGAGQPQGRRSRWTLKRLIVLAVVWYAVWSLAEVGALWLDGFEWRAAATAAFVAGLIVETWFVAAILLLVARRVWARLRRPRPIDDD